MGFGADGRRMEAVNNKVNATLASSYSQPITQNP
jgi:hypothetical protein